MVRECIMPYVVDFSTVSTIGLESSPVAAALAGLRANEARYFKNKYDHVFTVEPAGDAKAAIDWVHRILREERDIVISSRPLEATAFQVENIRNGNPSGARHTQWSGLSRHIHRFPQFTQTPFEPGVPISGIGVFVPGNVVAER
jgi:hypothetical protein